MTIRPRHRDYCKGIATGSLPLHVLKIRDGLSLLMLEMTPCLSFGTPFLELLSELI
jgi:hypothetical protein